MAWSEEVTSVLRPDRGGGISHAKDRGGVVGKNRVHVRRPELASLPECSVLSLRPFPACLAGEQQEMKSEKRAG